MANDINSVSFEGRLVKPAEAKFTASGTAVCNFSIANNRYIKDESAENGYRQVTSFFNCVAWAEKAEEVETYEKGQKIGFTARAQQRRYETKAGEKRSVVEFVVEKFVAVTDEKPKDAPPPVTEWGNNPFEGEAAF